ncbi:NlpC/P60 family protein [uncultured Cohaesibacter sp.]|uniref:C40 family peptidase n=1 Tax=uncultured Cohaesibacter sp. TaxID=1002546 RepID=UPI0029C7F4EB|nr:NlpC/P60 family protein [uncultured Cohaesibacter sp.]
MSWSDTYIGIPYRDLGRQMSGCDCWGLVHLVYRRECRINLPSYLHAYHSSDERAEVARLIGNAAASSRWHKVEDPEVFDVVTFRRGQLTSHIGIILRPDWMLHMSEAGARVENYRLPSWKQRLIGIYRHEERIT